MARAAKVMQTLKQDPVKAVKSVKGLFNRDLAWESRNLENSPVTGSEPLKDRRGVLNR